MTQHPTKPQTRETLIDPAFEKGSLLLTSAPSCAILICTTRDGDQDGAARPGGHILIVPGEMIQIALQIN